MEKLYPNSFIDKNTEVVTNFNLIEAATTNPPVECV
jgi:hypothetical protein